MHSNSTEQVDKKNYKFRVKFSNLFALSCGVNCENFAITSSKFLRWQRNALDYYVIWNITNPILALLEFVL